MATQPSATRERGPHAVDDEGLVKVDRLEMHEIRRRLGRHVEAGAVGNRDAQQQRRAIGEARQRRRVGRLLAGQQTGVRCDDRPGGDVEHGVVPHADAALVVLEAIDRHAQRRARHGARKARLAVKASGVQQPKRRAARRRRRAVDGHSARLVARRHAGAVGRRQLENVGLAFRERGGLVSADAPHAGGVGRRESDGGSEGGCKAVANDTHQLRRHRHDGALIVAHAAPHKAQRLRSRRPCKDRAVGDSDGANVRWCHLVGGAGRAGRLRREPGAVDGDDAARVGCALLRRRAEARRADAARVRRRRRAQRQARRVRREEDHLDGALVVDARPRGGDGAGEGEERRRGDAVDEVERRRAARRREIDHEEVRRAARHVARPVGRACVQRVAAAVQQGRRRRHADQVERAATHMRRQIGIEHLLPRRRRGRSRRLVDERPADGGEARVRVEELPVRRERRVVGPHGGGGAGGGRDEEGVGGDDGRVGVDHDVPGDERRLQPDRVGRLERHVVVHPQRQRRLRPDEGGRRVGDLPRAELVSAGRGADGPSHQRHVAGSGIDTRPAQRELGRRRRQQQWRAVGAARVGGAHGERACRRLRVDDQLERLGGREAGAVGGEHRQQRGALRQREPTQQRLRGGADGAPRHKRVGRRGVGADGDVVLDDAALGVAEAAPAREDGVRHELRRRQHRRERSGAGEGRREVCDEAVGAAAGHVAEGVDRAHRRRVPRAVHEAHRAADHQRHRAVRGAREADGHERGRLVDLKRRHRHLVLDDARPRVGEAVPRHAQLAVGGGDEGAVVRGAVEDDAARRRRGVEHEAVGGGDGEAAGGVPHEEGGVAREALVDVERRGGDAPAHVDGRLRPLVARAGEAAHAPLGAHDARLGVVRAEEEGVVDIGVGDAADDVVDQRAGGRPDDVELAVLRVGADAKVGDVHDRRRRRVDGHDVGGGARVEAGVVDGADGHDDALQLPQRHRQRRRLDDRDVRLDHHRSAARHVVEGDVQAREAALGVAEAADRQVEDVQRRRPEGDGRVGRGGVDGGGRDEHRAGGGRRRVDEHIRRVARAAVGHLGVDVVGHADAVGGDGDHPVVVAVQQRQVAQQPGGGRLPDMRNLRQINARRVRRRQMRCRGGHELL